MRFVFTNEHPTYRHEEIISYLRGPRLWIPHESYPDHERWLEKAYRELKGEYKRAMVALEKRQVVGAIIYQKHKEKDGVLEVKNITVRPDKRGRYVASFLLRNTEIEGRRDFGSRCIEVDSKARNFQIKNFLLKHNYQITDQKDLYKLGAGEDLLFRKELMLTP